MPTRSEGIDRLMPRATRRRPRWLALTDRAAAPASAEVHASGPAVPAGGDDESCYALVVDVDPSASFGLLGAPEEEPCYALVVDVTDPGESGPGTSGESGPGTSGESGPGYFRRIRTRRPRRRPGPRPRAPPR